MCRLQHQLCRELPLHYNHDRITEPIALLLPQFVLRRHRVDQTEQGAEVG